MTELIDLTQDAKFTKRPVVRFGGMFGSLQNLDRISWRTRRIESNEELRGRAPRLYGDTLSDEMDCVVRRCSDNTWLIGDPKRKEKKWFDNIFTEILYECCIKDPSAITICPRCGRKRITRDIYRTCYNCELEEHYRKLRDKLFIKKETKYVDWRDFTFDNYFNKETMETIRIQTIPYKIKQEILN